MKYTFVVAATITLGVDVEADDLESAVEQAKNCGIMGLCHHCAGHHDGEWSTSGELDCEPASSELVDLYIEGAFPLGEKLYPEAVKLWGGEE